MTYTGGCYCGKIRYQLQLDSPEDARTSLCHCHSCKKFFGNAFGLTTKVPKESLCMLKGTTIKHVSNNGSTTLYREFCGTCSSGILEYGEQAAPNFRYIMTGTLDKPGLLPPKGEFFCEYREAWIPEIPDIFHKQEIKE